jgi:putative salt-induced outer membrane protein
MRAFGLLGLLLFSTSVMAQNPPPDPIVGAAALGYLATSGNTDSTNANASFKLDWDRGGPWLHGWTALAVNASTDGATTAEAYAAGYKGRREFSETTYLFATGDWRQDRFSGYDKQTTEAVGYGRRLIDTDRQTLALEGGIGAKQSTLSDGTNLDEGIVRGGLDYILHISDTSDFTQKVLLEIGDENRYTEFVSAIKAKLVGDLALVASYTVKKNSDVLPGIEETDTFTALSLEYGF